MADPADRATAEQAIFDAAALSHRKPTGPRPIGQCHECGDDQIAPSALHCGDAECARRFNLRHGGRV